MKTLNYMLIAAVAAMTAISCAKDLGQENFGSDAPIKMTPIEITVANPVADEEAGPESKVSWRVARNPKWDANDSFQMFSFTAAEKICTPWGSFVTEEGSVTSGNSNATFKGYMPEGFTKATGGSTFVCIACNETNPSYNFTYESNPRYVFYYNIPSIQDGTGLKYTLLPTTVTYDESAKTFSSFAFNVRSALCALTLPAGSNIKKIEIEMTWSGDHTNDPASQFLVSNGTKQDFKVNASSSTFDSAGGGGSRLLTIENGGILPEGNTPVYFACNRTQSGAKFGICTLTFKFTNTDGLVATKAVPLYKDGKYYNISNGTKLNNFGTMSFADGDFQSLQ